MKLSPNLSAVLRRLLLTAATITTLVAIFVTVENWRGDRAWAEVERELRQRGELPPSAAAPLSVIPDAHNLIGAPHLSRLLYDRPGDSGHQRLLAETRLKEFAVLNEGHASSNRFSIVRDSLRKKGLFSGLDSASPAADVLAAMQPLHPLLNAIREASRLRADGATKRGLDLPVNSWLIAIDPIYAAGNALAARSAAELETGRTEDAYQDAIALLWLGAELSQSKSVNLLTLLVGNAMNQLTVPIIKSGYERRLWSDSQLAEFERMLGDVQLQARLRAALSHERAFVISAVDARRRQNSESFKWPIWIFHGLAQHNKVNYSRDLDRKILASLSGVSQPAASALQTPAPVEDQSVLGRLRYPYRWLSVIVLANLDEIVEGVGSSCDRLSMLRVACAWERYRLVAGSHPSSLDLLVPKFLPAIPSGAFDGKILQMRRSAEGRDELYSLGKNLRNDLGVGDDEVLRLPGG